jgi:hypothetical protein
MIARSRLALESVGILWATLPAHLATPLSIQSRPPFHKTEYTTTDAPMYLFRSMETMRRLFAILVAVGLAAGTFGCHHTHGVCDCDNADGCGGCSNSSYINNNNVIPGPALKPMPAAERIGSPKEG